MVGSISFFFFFLQRFRKGSLFFFGVIEIRNSHPFARNSSEKLLRLLLHLLLYLLLYLLHVILYTSKYILFILGCAKQTS